MPVKKAASSLTLTTVNVPCGVGTSANSVSDREANALRRLGSISWQSESESVWACKLNTSANSVSVATGKRNLSGTTVQALLEVVVVAIIDVVGVVVVTLVAVVLVVIDLIEDEDDSDGCDDGFDIDGIDGGTSDLTDWTASTASP